MSTAGYSGTPLIRKLGIKAGMKIAIVDPPDGYDETLGPLPDGVRRLQRLGRDLDFIHFFVARRAPLRRRLPSLERALATDGMLWISWPKKSSPLHRDLDREDVREAGLEAGLVDVKVCAVDEDWSALKFVYRLADR